MRTVRFSRAVQLVAAVGVLALVACGGGSSGSSAKAYEAEWEYVSGGMVSGPDLLNLRSDGAFSQIVYLSGTIGDKSGGIYAIKGTYDFVPTTPGDDTAGTLTLHRTHYWNAGTWTPNADDFPGACTVTAGSPRTMVWAGMNYEYHGPQVSIPTTP